MLILHLSKILHSSLSSDGYALLTTIIRRAVS